MYHLWYLASPYSLFPGGLEMATRVVSREAARLLEAGIPVVSPIAHSHTIAVHSGVVDAGRNPRPNDEVACWMRARPVRGREPVVRWCCELTSLAGG